MFRSDVAVEWNELKSLAPLGSLIPFVAAVMALLYAAAPSDSAVSM